MSKFTIMGSHPGDGGVYEATDFFNAFVKFILTESCAPDLNATEKKEVRNALALQWNKAAYKAKTISANHVVFGSYEIKKIK